MAITLMYIPYQPLRTYTKQTHISRSEGKKIFVRLIVM